MKSYFIVALSILFLLSCSNEDTYNAPVFKDMGVLIGDTIISDVMCSRVLSIDIIDTLLLVQCINSMDKKPFYLYNKNTGKLLKTFGNYGNGPGELSNSFEYTLDKKNKILYTIGNKSLLSFNLDSVLLNNDYRFSRQIQLNTIANSTPTFFYKDSLFLSMNDARPERDYRLAIVNSKWDTISCYRQFPTIQGVNNEDHMSVMQFYVYKTIGACKPDGSQFVIATTCGLNMELFSIKNNHLDHTNLLRFIEPKCEINSSRNDGVLPGLAWSLFASDAYIYGLWSEDTDKLFPEKIVTFNWKGTPCSQYSFGPGMAGGWTIENDSTAYITIKDAQGRLNIVKYKLQ